MEREDAEIEQFCHVCELPVTGREGEQTYEILGKIYKFCSPECFKEYLENPEKYARQDEEEEEE